MSILMKVLHIFDYCKLFILMKVLYIFDYCSFIFDYCSFILRFEIRIYESLNFVLHFQECFDFAGLQGPLLLYLKFTTSVSISEKKEERKKKKKRNWLRVDLDDVFGKQIINKMHDVYDSINNLYREIEPKYWKWKRTK